jgi:Flp pilus assembly protein CpaB
VRRHPLVRGGCIVIAGVVGLSLVHHAIDHALDTQRRWGTGRTVVVARHRMEIGAVVAVDDVESASWPAAVIPDNAVTAAPVGRTVVAAIERGEAVVATRLAPDGLMGVAALVPPGWRAVAIPVGPTVVSVHVGDRVDLIAGFDAASTEAGQSPALVVARDASVVAVDDERITVAVRDNDVERVAFAVVAGTVVAALRAT